MRARFLTMLLAASAVGPATSQAQEALIWGFQAEQLEYRLSDDSDVLAWDFDALVGTDEVKFVWRSEAEYAIEPGVFETLENQARIQVPISPFFDAVVGVRVDTPDGPDRVHGVVGFHGLAPQWFEIDADFFVSDKPSFRFEVEYEALLTNRLILTPSIEMDLPFADDDPIGVGAFGPKFELGLRLSYDLIDRAVVPYVGVHYERVFGETADLARADGEEVEDLLFVMGVRVRF